MELKLNNLLNCNPWLTLIKKTWKEITFKYIVQHLAFYVLTSWILYILTIVMLISILNEMVIYTIHPWLLFMQFKTKYIKILTLLIYTLKRHGLRLNNTNSSPLIPTLFVIWFVYKLQSYDNTTNHVIIIIDGKPS
jgi:hypothetical protein